MGKSNTVEEVIVPPLQFEVHSKLALKFFDNYGSFNLDADFSACFVLAYYFEAERTELAMKWNWNRAS